MNERVHAEQLTRVSEEPSPDVARPRAEAVARAEQFTERVTEQMIEQVLRDGAIDERTAAELRALPLDQRFDRMRDLKAGLDAEKVAALMRDRLVSSGVIDAARAAEIDQLPPQERRNTLVHLNVAAEYPDMPSDDIDDLFGKVPEQPKLSPLAKAGEMIKSFFGF